MIDCVTREGSALLHMMTALRCWSFDAFNVFDEFDVFDEVDEFDVVR